MELLDERGTRDAETARGLALVLARGLELGADDRALERLDAGAERMARARIARRARALGGRDGALAESRANATGERETVVGRQREEPRDRVLDSRTLPGHEYVLNASMSAGSTGLSMP